jgi:ankyrin repeat protein
MPKRQKRKESKNTLLSKQISKKQRSEKKGSLINLLEKEDESGTLALLNSGNYDITEVYIYDISLCYPDIKNNRWSAIFLAISHDFLSVVDKLLTKHSELLNSIDSMGNTPLHLAMSLKRHKIIERLLKEPEINVNAKNNDGDTPLHEVNLHELYSQDYTQDTIQDTILPKLLSCVKLLIKHNDINVKIKNSEGNTILHMAVRCHYKIVELLVNQYYSIPVNAQNNEGKTPLHFSSEKGKYGGNEKCGSKSTRFLLYHKKINVNIKDNEGNAPFISCNYNDYRISDFLRHKHININLKDKDGKTLLMHLSNSPCNKSLPYSWSNLQRCLHHPDIDIHAKDKHGNTALHYATLKSLKILLNDSRFNVNIKNNVGESPLFFLMNYSWENFRRYGDYKKERQEIFELFLQHPKIDVNTKDNCGETLFEHIILRYKGDNYWDLIITKLLEHPNINVNQSGRRYTPLQLACRLINITAIKCLLKHPELDIDFKDSEGETALSKLIRRDQKTRELSNECINLLKEATTKKPFYNFFNWMSW